MQIQLGPISLDLFYFVPIILGLIIAAFFVIKHNKKVEAGGLPKESAKVNHRAKIRNSVEKFEEKLLSSDVGSAKTDEIISAYKASQTSGNDGKTEAEVSAEFLSKSSVDRLVHPEKKPHTMMFVGVNGVGKTTSLGKIAYSLSKQGSSVVLGAADTFRAAAADQLEVWADRASHLKKADKTAGKVQLVRKDGADAASVAFDAAKVAVDSGADYLLIDTAGRMQNNSNLLEELKKIKRVVEKTTPVDEVILVLDATVGQNALEQAQQFSEAVDITGVVLTKMDGTARGGIVFKVTDLLGVPVEFLGLGEGADQLQKFTPELFAKMLLK